MKRFYLIIIVLCISAAVSAQSLSLSNVGITGDPAGLLEAHARVTNNSNVPLNVIVERVYDNPFPGHDSYFCWVQCYPPHISVAPDPINIPPGGFADDFAGDIETYGIPGVSEVSYCFYDQANPGDSVCVEFVFTGTTGISDIPSSRDYISPAFPNPATEFTSFYYNKDNPSSRASIRIYNVLGSLVKDVALNETRSSIRISTNDLKSGLYVYSYFVDGKNVSSGKLMVNRN